MNLLWTFLTVMTVIALVISFFLKGKAMAARVREFLGTSKQRAVKFMSEFKRKTFHLVGLLVPGIYYFGLKFGFLTKFQACSIVAGFAGFSLTVDLLRLKSERFNKMFQESPAGKIMRKKELNDINGSTYYLIGSLLTMILFHPTIAIASLLFLDLGDLFAALVGISFGRVKVYKNKSLEGCLANFFICMAVGLTIFYHVHLYEYISLIGAITATLTELFLDQINDNLSIPIMSGIALTLAQWRLGVEIPFM
ncbi:hypothetical protein FDP41_012576 [Naegleria fowleri]|uniref:Dolichol kinase n=1 Tax=Naegleria fowleri TaxID=5763 RepID=A0A6A5C0W0_NAEFO|nr:uncharacterized protein FDP41_012576 [Naegleria fowleri]KAF0981316.1 hypothetical protein FDP41_012576 [Naegleria fowleri]